MTAVVDDLLLSDEEIDGLTLGELQAYRQILGAEAAAGRHRDWRVKARTEQLPPDGDWRTLFLRGGRGSGKSWAGAHTLVELIKEDPIRATDGPGQWAIVAPTFGDARDKCIESEESGLLMALGTNMAEVAAGRSTAVTKYNRSLGEVELRDGTQVYIDGADDGAYRIQGYNLRGAWCDEIGLWRSWEVAWDESLGFALRKGQARRVATGTPKRDQPARALVKRLLAADDVVSRRLRTADNVDNLSPAFFAEVARYEGTSLGRQELEGELLEDVEGALWERAWIDDHRVTAPPATGFRRTVVALDPADGIASGDEQALCAVSVDLDGRLYVRRSEGMRVTPTQWLTHAVQVARELDGILVIEANHGGRFLVDLLEQVMGAASVRAPYQMITASQGKATRAEPVAALYEQGRVHHVGVHRELEDQLLEWQGLPGEKSPDRLDSAVWALRALMSYATPAGGAGSNRAVPYPLAGAPRRADGAVPWQ